MAALLIEAKADLDAKKADGHSALTLTSRRATGWVTDSLGDRLEREAQSEREAQRGRSGRNIARGGIARGLRGALHFKLAARARKERCARTDVALAPDRARLLSQLLDAGCDVLPLRTSAVTLQEADERDKCDKPHCAGCLMPWVQGPLGRARTAKLPEVVALL